jgi:hypothetical protein
MPASKIRFQERALRLYKCSTNPDLGTRTILVEDQWEYVDMWLKRNNKQNALFFWRQAEAFAKASEDLPKTSSPLTRYYAALNATKALLLSKGLATAPFHGITGRSLPGPASLTNETVKIKGGGTLYGLCQYLGESTNGETYNIEDILYNLVYVHRAYTVTFPAKSELFIPIADPSFVRVDGTSQSYFRFKLVDRIYQSSHWLAKIGQFEHDTGIAEDFVVRMKPRFKWSDANTPELNLALQTLSSPHPPIDLLH